MEGSTGTRRRWRSGVSSCAAALLVGIAAGVGPGRRLDRRLYRALNRRAGRAADLALGSITELGSIWASVGAASVVAVAGDRRREAVDALGAALAMWALGQGLKRAFVRPRPYEGPEPFRLLIARPKGTSWPSSHPAVLLTFCSVLARDLHLPEPLPRKLLALAALVGLSRIYLGVHYPADVVGGLLLGRGVAELWSATISPHAVPSLSAGGPR